MNEAMLFMSCLCFYFVGNTDHSALFPIRPVCVSWLIAQQKLVSRHNCVSCPSGLGICVQPPSNRLLFLCSGMDMEERTRQMKMKLSKYKQGAGSDSRLEQDYHKVKIPECCM